MCYKGKVCNNGGGAVGRGGRDDSEDAIKTRPGGEVVVARKEQRREKMDLVVLKLPESLKPDLGHCHMPEFEA